MNYWRNMKTKREQINKIDQELIKLLEKRFQLSKEIGEYKKQNNLPVEDKKREQEIIEKIKNQTTCKEQREIIIETFEFIINKSKKIQEK